MLPALTPNAPGDELVSTLESTIAYSLLGHFSLLNLRTPEKKVVSFGTSYPLVVIRSELQLEPKLNRAYHESESRQSCILYIHNLFHCKYFDLFLQASQGGTV